MSGSTIGGVIGGVVGFFFGAPQLGYVLGSAIGGAIDPEEIRGPSIGDAQRQTSQAGIPRPVVYGHPAPFNGNIIDGESKARKIEQTEGGKGGPEVTTERFILTSAIRICEGPIAGVLKIWRNDQLVFDRTTDSDFPDWTGGDAVARAAYIAAIRAKTTAFNDRVTIYFGEEDQLPDPTLEAIHGVGNTPYYRGTAYIVVRDDDVTDMRGAAAQWKFEVVSAGTDTSLVNIVPTATPDAHFDASGGLTTNNLHLGTSEILSGFPGLNLAPVIKLIGERGGSDVGDGPIRARAWINPGSFIFDSGWIGNPAYQGGLEATLAFNGRMDLAGTISPTEPVEQIIDFVTAPTQLYVEVMRAGVPGGPSSSTVSIRVLWPNDASLPDGMTTTPELPHVILGSDGEMYVPAYVTPVPVMSTLSPTDITLAPVIQDIAGRCKVAAANLDVSALVADVLPGLLVAQQGTGADCLIPLQRGYFFDFPEYDLKLRAIRRGGSTVAAITDADLLEGEEQTRPQAVEYPLKVSVVTQDPDANYAPVPQTSLRFSLEVEATSEVTLPLAIPFRADDARQIADKLHKVLWTQAEGRIELPLPEKFSTLVPSDCITYGGRRWLIEKTNYADGEMRAEATYDRASAYSSDATGQPAPAPTLPSSGLSGPTLLQFLNLPILRDQDDRLGFYVAVAGVADGWRGAVVQGRIRDSDAWQDLATITVSSVMGSLLTALPNASWDVIDDDNTVQVQVVGTLSTITLEQLLNEGNACVIGEEICQFQNADFVSEGVYDLDTLTRGRLNTSTALHAIGSRFVLLNAPVFIEAPSTWIGQTLQLRAVTLGTASDNAQTISAVWSPALSQTEWPPVQFIGRRDSSNNVAISWVGQGRLGSNKSAHPSQFFDGYRVSITKGAVTVNYTTVSQSFSYPAAQQTIDFGSATGTLTVSVVALNRITGASAALSGSIP